MSTANDNTDNPISKHSNEINEIKGSGTHSLPVQKLDASLASHVTTPLNSSVVPIRPSGFKFDHLLSRCGLVPSSAADMLKWLSYRNAEV